MRFNFFKAKEQATRNHEGALAWKMDTKAELYAAVVTVSLSGTFHKKACNNSDAGFLVLFRK
jgi:hypothetical protein